MAAIPHPGLADAPLLVAARGGRASRVPVWFMRQAGRSLPEYRALRGEGSILDAIRDPDAVGRDHAAAGAPLRRRRRHPLQRHRRAGRRHRLRRRRRARASVRSSPSRSARRPTSTGCGPSSPRSTRPTSSRPCATSCAELGATPLIGFAGAPFTVASYLIEGRPSRTYGLTKAMLHGEPTLWHALLDRLADLAIASLRAQVEAGRQRHPAVRLVGRRAVPRRLRASTCCPTAPRCFAAVGPPACRASTSASAPASCSALMGDAGADVVGVDWRVPLDVARERVPGKAVQGNLDPAVCLAPWEVVADRTRDVLRRNGGRPGHIFNLGHGVLPEIDPGVLEQVVDLVHEEGRTDG